ncbi:MAG: 3-methyl-2-oxobutanoate hydroxymethyltransferase [SAR202 cluster bacterium]|nr:3-methyl-2-oxobutanoate hydroxymethyltransferase [SAR202 cluster bacterium]
MGNVSVLDVAEMKARGEKIPMITAYDFTSAQISDRAGIPLLLVGDSLGMVVLGYDSTIPVTMEDMLHHSKAVARGASRAMIVVDLPFMSYQVDASQAMANAARLMQEGGAHAVKLEGGETVAPTVRRLTEAGIPVMGHIGLTPQSVHALGGYKVQGRDQSRADQLIKDADALQEAGAFAVVLEVVPAELAGLITEGLTIPTIGIGAGPRCDGQVQVLHDMLGLYTDVQPKHVKRYAGLADVAQSALAGYAEEVRSRAFPTKEHSFSMDKAALKALSETA